MAEDDASHLTNTVPGNTGTVVQIGNANGPITLVQRPGRAVAVLAVAVLGVALVHGIVLARYAEFYRALGVSLGEVPVGYGEFVAATAETVVVAVTVVVVLVASYAVGAALIPSAPSAGLVAPAAALAMVVYASCVVAVVYGSAYAALLPQLPGGAVDLVATLVVAIVGLGWLGSAARLVRGWNTNAYLAGCAVGAAALVAAAAPAVALRVWLLAQPWPLPVFFAGAAGAVVALRRWHRRRATAADVGDGTGSTDRSGSTDSTDGASAEATNAADDSEGDGEVSAQGGDRAGRGGGEPTARPRDLLTRLWHDLVPFSDPRDLGARVPGAQARRTAIAALVASGLMGVLGLAGYLLAAGSAVDAGLAVREYGYLPPERSALALPRTVRPVEVAPAATGADPAGICDGPERAATLIGRSDGAAWLLLRPVEADKGSPEVVPVSTTDYVIRLSPDSTLGSEPWTRPVCGP